MTQLVALDWTNREVRAAVASRHGDRVVIDDAFAIPLPEGEENAGEQPGPSIAAALRDRGIGPVDALVTVGRGGVELRQLQLPAAPDEELPGMVRLRAMLEFNELDDRWLLDFVPVDDAGQGHRNILAAAIAPATVDRIQTLGQQCGLRIQRVLLRSCATAALAVRARLARPGQVQLLVELFSSHADLTAVVDGRVLLPRAVHLSGDISQPPGLQGLLTEIRLTLAAVQNQFDGRRVEGIVLCGRGEADAAIARRIGEAVAAPATLLDPFACVELGARLRQAIPEQPGRFAAVLGMLTMDRDQIRNAIDFLHPRQPAAVANPRKKWLIAAAAAALVMLAYIVFGRLAYRQLADEVRQLEARSAAAENVLRAAGNQNLAAANEIGNWADGEIVWLDRLRELMEDFPPADTAMVNHLMLSCQTDRSIAMRPSSAAVGPLGRMHLEGRAKDAKAVTAVEKSLGAHVGRLESSKTSEDRSAPPYTLNFSATVQVGRGSK
jgi:Tfp pilus assembly PilM family ATPase